MKGYRLYIIRHGQTEANEKGIYIGKTDFPLSDKGRNELVEKLDEYEYTDEGILNTLKYIYEVKHMSVQKADERIGLVPYYYDKAQLYFAQKEKEKVEIMNSMSAAVTNSINETLVINTKTDIKRKPVLINPMDWWEEEDESSR